MSVYEPQAAVKSTEDMLDVDVVAVSATTKRKDKEPEQRERELGKSILPFSRVQKIIKADKELPIIARDATFLISLATEQFIRRLAQACQKRAEREKRATVQQKDVASVVRQAEEFMFLHEIIAVPQTEAPPKRKPAAWQSTENQNEPTMLDRFVAARREESQDVDDADVVMDEDG